MPVLRNSTAFEVARGVKAFLNLEAGFTRGELPEGNGTSPKVQQIKRSARQLVGRGQRMIRSRNGLAGAQDVPVLPASVDVAVPIFFVVGQSRSGTTWLMRLLNSHPEILCLGEGRFFGQNWKEHKIKKMPVNKQPSSLYGALSDAQFLRLWIERSVWSRDGDPDEHINNLTRLAINYFLTQKLGGTGKSIVGDKTPLLAPGIIEEISTIYPGARVVHIVRDGRDQAVSLMHYLWNTARAEGGLYPVEPEELAKREVYRENPQKLLEAGEGIFTEDRLRKQATSWSNRVGDALRNGPALLGANYLELRYEDLLQSSEQEAERLLTFLGADASSETVKRCVDNASFEKSAKGREQGREDSTSFVRKGVAGDWRSVFTERDKEIFKEAAGDVLIEAGYEKDKNW